MGKSKDKDLEEISEILDVVSEKLSDLINSLLNTIYSPEAAVKMGKAVGGLYKELVDSGIPQDAALKMASDYMLSLKDITKGLSMGDKKQK